jgi:hypothetical protein
MSEEILTSWYSEKWYKVETQKEYLAYTQAHFLASLVETGCKLPYQVNGNARCGTRLGYGPPGSPHQDKNVLSKSK